MEKKQLLYRSLILSGLAVSSGRDTVLPEYEKPIVPRVAKAHRVLLPVSVEEFDLPSIVTESLVVFNDQPILALNVEKKEPDRVITELEDKESGEILENVQIEVYHEERGTKEIWGITIPVTEESTAISVDLILPEAQNTDSEGQTSAVVRRSQENIVDLTEGQVESIIDGGIDRVDIVIVQNPTTGTVEEFNQFPNGGAFEGDSKNEVAVQLNVEVGGVLYTTTESLPQE